MIRFELALDPVAWIPPWTDGQGGDPHLHWFGLTLGEHWIVVDGHELYRYEDATVSRLTGREDVGDARRHAHYQVARLWEDLLQRLPRYLEPVPADLVDLVRAGDDQVPAWDPSFDDEEDAAAAWWAEHYLEEGHMAVPTVKWWRALDHRGDDVGVDGVVAGSHRRQRHPVRRPVGGRCG